MPLTTGKRGSSRASPSCSLVSGGRKSPIREKRQERSRSQTSGGGSGCCDPALSQHDATLLVHSMQGRRQMTATRRPVIGSVVTIGSVRVIHPLSQRGSGQGINCQIWQSTLFKSPGR
jgi:hypothetical protein